LQPITLAVVRVAKSINYTTRQASTPQSDNHRVLGVVADGCFLPNFQGLT
jgi:hypothetical protein